MHTVAEPVPVAEYVAVLIVCVLFKLYVLYYAFILAVLCYSA